MDRRKIEQLFAGSGKIRALVIGDLMIDEYLWGKAERISPEAPVQVVDVLREDLRLGGAGNVASNLSALGVDVSVCSVIGDDDNGALLKSTFSDMGICTAGLFKDLSRKTGKKTRVMASHQQIVRIDRESKDNINVNSEVCLIDWLKQNAGNFNVLVVSDYLKGVLTPSVLTTIIALGKAADIPVVVDPKGSDYSRYRGATILTPNRKEAEQASGLSIVDDNSLNMAAGRLLGELDLSALLITRSEAGMSLFKPSAEPLHIPTVAREVYDVTGAGDTVLALLSLGLASNLSFADAAFLANIAAGIIVGKLGTSTITQAEILSELSRDERGSEGKIKSLDHLAAVITSEKARGKKVVFTNGCFDLLHAGHVKYLQKARALGDLLVLGLNSDASVRRLKGEKRPLISEDERAHILAALDCIDHVVIFDEDTPLSVIETLKPFILAKGGDYTLDNVVGREVVEAEGGRVELVQFVDGKSTTNIIEKILESYGE